MPVALQKFDSYAEQEARGVHNWGAHTFKAALSNTPPAATNQVLTDITQIAAAGGYTAGAGGGFLLDSVTVSRSGGTTKVTIADEVITASGAAIGPFRYIVIYNDSTTSPVDALCFYFDVGAATTINDGDSYTLDFDGVNGVWTKS